MQTQSIQLSELATRVGGRLVGDGSVAVSRVSSIEDADAASLVFIEDIKLLSRVAASRAAGCITPLLEETELSLPRIEVKRPKLAFAIAAGLLHPARQRPAGIDSTAVVASSA